MSWNFEVNAVGAKEAERLFNNAVFQNQAYMGNNTQQKVKALGRTALYQVPSTRDREATVSLRSHGHIDPLTGYGNITVGVEYKETPEAPPA